MRHRYSLLVLGIISLFVLLGCRRDGVVYAGNEGDQSGVYQPRSVAQKRGKSREARKPIDDHKAVGELIKVDIANNLITIRTENGMEQTFKFDNTTEIDGIENPAKKGRKPVSLIKSLSGREGDIVVVEFEIPTGPRIATSVDVK